MVSKSNYAVILGVMLVVLFLFQFTGISQDVVLRSGENVLLDDVTTQDISKALQVPVNIVKSSGYDFTETILGRF